jgi:hypothetical protein
VQHLFIVTYGKSGSTLLTGLLNSLPGYQIMGENGGVLVDLARYHRKVTAARDQWSGDERLTPAHPWHGIDGYPAEVALERMRALVTDTLLRPRPGTTVSGFKEIRWTQDRPQPYLDFVDQLFPGARYLLNTRNLDDVAQSGWWRTNPAAREQLQVVEDSLKAAVASRGDRGFHVHYDDYARDPAALQELCRWLGADYDADRFAAVMEVPHSTHTR